MAGSLRQEIEKIVGVNDELNHGVRCKCSTCLYRRKQLDRICEAIGKTVEGMPDVIEAEVDYLAGYADCRDACQAYWKGQIKE